MGYGIIMIMTGRGFLTLSTPLVSTCASSRGLVPGAPSYRVSYSLTSHPQSQIRTQTPRRITLRSLVPT